MEKELFHENLSLIYEHFGKDRPFVTLNEAAKFLRKDCRTLEADKTFPMRRIGAGKQWDVSLIALARWMCL